MNTITFATSRAQTIIPAQNSKYYFAGRQASTAQVSTANQSLFTTAAGDSEKQANLAKQADNPSGAVDQIGNVIEKQ